MKTLLRYSALGMGIGLLLAPAGTAQAQAPVITGVAPLANARAVARTSPVTVSFDQNLTAGSAGALKVHSFQRGGLRTLAVPAVVSGRTLTFAPTAYPWMPGETVYATVTPAAAGSGGTLAAARSLQFTAAVGGTGQGNFRAPAAPEVLTNTMSLSSVLADVDGDGDLDILTGNSSVVHVCRNDGTGAFTTSLAFTAGLTTDLATGDLDGDGDLDFVALNGSSPRMNIRFNDGLGTFTNSAPSTQPGFSNGIKSLALADIDGDGDLDIVAGNYDSSWVSIRTNNGAGVFNITSGPDVSTGPGSQPFDVAVGDVDGDGDQDFVTANYGNATAAVRLNGGDASGSNTGTFSNGSSVGVGAAPHSIALGDVDGDGDLDLMTANYLGASMSVRLNNGRGIFTAPATGAECAVGINPIGITLGDVDGDGDLDAAVANNGDASVSIRLNNGVGGFAAPATDAEITVLNFPNGVVLGDLDGDNDLDLVTPNRIGQDPSGMIPSFVGSASVRLNNARALGTTAAVSGSLLLFPNPAHGAATLTGLVPHAPVTVLDALGRPVLTTPADGNGTARLTLPAGLAPGLYLVRSGGLVRHLAVE